MDSDCLLPLSSMQTREHPYLKVCNHPLSIVYIQGLYKAYEMAI